MPALKPDAGIVARREEHELHGLDARLVRRGHIGAQADRGAHVRRTWMMADIGGDESDGADELRPQGRERPRHAIAEGVPDHESRTAGIVVSITAAISAARSSSFTPSQGPAARADAARLRPQHAIARIGKLAGDRIEIARAAAERRQQHDRTAFALHQHFEPRVAARHHDVCRRRGRRRHSQEFSQGGLGEKESPCATTSAAKQECNWNASGRHRGRCSAPRISDRYRRK